MEDEATARADARQAARSARQAGAAGARRQGAGGLERADDRRPGQCRRAARTSRRGSQLAARAFMFIAAKMAHGDRLGHSWREGRLLFPGLASDHAAMIRAALALHEATGEHGYLERALAWQGDARPALCQSAVMAATSSPPTMPKAWWCARAPPPTTPSRTPMRSPRRTWCGSRPSPASMPGATRPTGCSTGIFAGAGENLFGHLALLNALDLRLRAAEIVVAGRGPRADAAPCGRPAAAVPRSHRAARAVRRRAAGVASGAGQDLAAASDAAAFVCVGETCSLPVTTPDAIAEAVAAMWR